MPQDENLIELMHRRAELLSLVAAAKSSASASSTDGASASSGNKAGDGASDPRDSKVGPSPDGIAAELGSVTTALRSGMADEPVRIRSLSPDADRVLLTRLGRDEAVNPLDDPEDADELADRVATDRRVYVLEHPGLVGHPLNVVWVALSVGTPESITNILGPARRRFEPDECDTAVFYSIWNVEPGLSGIPGGSALLGLAMEELGAEFPDLETFVTLSPIPGFRRWTASPEAQHGATDLTLPPEDARDDLLRSCARYLTEMGPDGRLVDSVARFHMRNGARLWRINWAGDPSQRGVERSFGLMANYRYAPEDRDTNKAALAERTPAVGSRVAELLG